MNWGEHVATRRFTHRPVLLDLAATRAFYEDVLGFRLVTIEQIDFEEKGLIRHAFFDCGDGQLLGFDGNPHGIGKDYRPKTTPASIKSSACPNGFTTSPSTLARSKSCTRSARS